MFNNAGKGKFRQTVVVVIVMLMAALGIIKWHAVLPLFPPGKQLAPPILWAIDSESYLAMARGETTRVVAPFTKRFVSPWLARQLSAVTGEPLPEAFLDLNLGVLLLLAFCLAEILRLTVGQPMLALLFLLTPFPLESFQLGYLPDLANTAMVAAYFLLLLRERWQWSLAALLVAFFIRESTLLLCLTAGGLAWLRAKKAYAAGVGGVLVAGSVAGGLMARLGQPNARHLPDFIYMVAKVPYYFLLSIFGLRLVPADERSLVSWHVPVWLKIGEAKTIGIAYPDWRYPVSTAICWSTVFGIGPFVFWWLWRRRPNPRQLPFAIEVALVYGGISFLLAPFLGDWVDRLVGYGWPLFWIATPWLIFADAARLAQWRAILLVVCFEFVSWWPRFFNYGHNRSVNPWPCFGAIVFYIIAWQIMRRIHMPSPCVTSVIDRP